MGKLLQLQHLKRLNAAKHKIGAILLLVAFITFFSSFSNEKEDNYPKINKETVRKDILTNYNDFFDKDYFRNRDTTLFGVNYFDGYCFVHIPYRTTQTSFKASVVVIYHFKNKKWEYQSTIPYYSALRLIESKKKLFLSDNEYCEGNGSCNYYCELSHFDGDSLIPIISYSGFNEEVYFVSLLIKGDINEVLHSKGDTIKNVVKLCDFIFDDKGLKSYMRERKIGILTGVEKDMNDYDSLVTKQLIIKERIEYNSADWDLN